MLRHSFILISIGIACISNGALADQKSPAAPEIQEIKSFQQPTNDDRFTSLTALLRSHNLNYAIEPFDGGSKTKPLSGRNVVVTIGGKGRTIVVSAHYDAHAVEGGGIAPGATDNAAAVVELVHVAELLKRRKLTHQIKFVFFDQEEIGRIGSVRYSAAHAMDTAAVLNLDIAAWSNTLIYSEPTAPGGSKLVDVTRELCARRQMTCVGYPIFPISDDLSFSDNGVPALGLAILSELEAHQMWLILNSGNPEKWGPMIGPNLKLMSIMHTPADSIDKVEPATVSLGEGLMSDYVVAVDKAFR